MFNKIAIFRNISEELFVLHLRRKALDI